MRVLLIAVLALFALPAQAEDRVVADLNQHSVSLTTGFSGSELLVWGGFDRKANTDDYDILVTVTGPTERVIVRKKQRQLGIWVNGKGVEVDEAPSFYAVASTKKFYDTVSYTDDLRYRIALDKIIRLVDAPSWVAHREEYRQAVVRLRQVEGLYAFLPHSVTIKDFIFSTRIKLPANLVEGDYRARIFLIKDKAVLDVSEETIEVRRAGLGRMIYTAAQDHPVWYGIASILVALIAGWLASAFFRTFFPN